MNKKFSQYTQNPEKEYMSGNSIDCVILGYEEKELKILLLKWKYLDLWSLPGGFIHKEEAMDDAAHRILAERTGLKSIFLNQFYTFGNTDRSHLNETGKEASLTHIFKEMQQVNSEFLTWIKNRFITTGYYALVDIRKVKPKADLLSQSCTWHSIDKLPELLMDHYKIISKALDHLRIQLNYLPVGISLLPEKFTMQELQKLYEAILQRPLERSNFQRKMLKLEIFDRLEKQYTGAANKAPYLYSFNKEKYLDQIKEGIGFTY